MNKTRRTSSLYNIITYDDNGDIVVPASLTLGTAPLSSDNSAKVATTSWIRTYVSGLSYATSASVSTAIANLVGAAPATLDTLNELATALGNDPNFATTIATSIGGKLSLTGGTLTGDLTLSGTNPRIFLTDTDNNPDYFISNTDGTFTVYDVTNSVGRFKIYTTGSAEFSNQLTAASFVRLNGLATQFLKADGSIDSSTYLTGITSAQVTTALGFTPYNASNPSGYLTASTVLGTVLTPYAVGANTAVTTTDTIETAIEKLQGQVNARQASLSGTGFVKSTAGVISYDTNTYALSTHTHTYYVGTTAVQTSSANQALSGITGITFVAEASDAASITTTISSTSTFFDFNLADDNNNDEWRWRFTPSGATVYNAMRLVPVSNTASNLIVSGTITGSQIIRSGGTAAQFLKADGSVDSSTYLTGITSSQVTTALGYTPYNATNPSGYITASSLSSYLPLAGGTMTGNVIASGDTYTTYGPNSTWTSYLRVGGNGRTVSGNAYASIVTTNGNLHIDAGDGRGTYINFYAGTFGIAFGNGASGVVASVDSSGNIWKGTTVGAGTQYVYNSGTWSIGISGNAATASAVAWSGITGKPSSLSGYGIGDAVTAYYNTDINPNTQVGNYTTMTTQSGISGWTHVLSMAWSASSVSNWVSQIAFAAQAGDGAYYRTTSGNISGLAWKRLIDSGNIGSQSVNYATSAGSASSAGYASSAGAVVHNSGRTDSAWYNVGWFSSSPSPAYSADGVQIQSSTNSLKAQNLTANGNLYAGASFTALGSNATYQIARSFGISGADYKHKYILLARVPTFGNSSVNCAFRGRITSDRVNDLGMNVDQDISLSIGYGNNVYWNTQARAGNTYSLVVYNYNGTNYLALYMYTAPNYFQGTFTGMVSDFGSWLDGNFLTVVELSSANHSAASYNQWTSTIMGNAVLHAGNASYAYNMNQNVRTSDGPTFNNVYNDGWFRNNNNLQGLYSPPNNIHLYAGNNFWNMTSNNQGEGGLKLRVDHENTIKGYLFYNSSGFGLLNNSGDWAIRTNYGGSNTGGTLYGSWVVNTATDGATLTLGALDNSRTYNDTNRHSLVINAPYYPHLYVNATNNAGNTTHGPVISMTGVKSSGGFRRWGMGIANLDPGYFSIGWYDDNSNPHYGVGHNTGIGGRFIIDTAGNIWCTGDVTAYGAQSDARLKTIKEKVPNALEGILKLNGYRFDWKERDVKITTFVEDIGVVAQEVADVFPELAREGEDGWMSVRYQGLTAVLIEAVKEQQTQIQAQQSELTELKDLVKQLLAK